MNIGGFALLTHRAPWRELPVTETQPEEEGCSGLHHSRSHATQTGSFAMDVINGS